MLDLTRLIGVKFPGVPEWADGIAMKIGRFEVLPGIAPTHRGAMARIEGGAGVADRIVILEKGTSDDLEWHDIGQAALDDRYVQPGSIVIPPAGIQYITTSSYSAASSHSVNDVFSPSFEKYMLIISPHTHNTSGARLWLRFRRDGTDDSGANYAWEYGGGAAGMFYGLSDTSDNQAYLLQYTAQTITNALVTITVTRVNTLTQTMLSWHGGVITGSGSLATVNGIGYNGEGGAGFDGFTLSVSAGTMNGTVKVYGISDS